MARHQAGERRVWRVMIGAHTVGGRYRIAAGEQTRFEGERRQAIAAAIRQAHMGAGVPAWRPYLKASVRHTTAIESVYKP